MLVSTVVQTPKHKNPLYRRPSVVSGNGSRQGGVLYLFSRSTSSSRWWVCCARNADSCYKHVLVKRDPLTLFCLRTSLQTSERGFSAANYWARPDLEPHPTPPNLAEAHHRREASGGTSDESARTSLRRGGSPSRLAVLEMGRDGKLAAKERLRQRETHTTVRRRLRHMLPVAKEQRFASVPLRAIG